SGRATRSASSSGQPASLHGDGVGVIPMRGPRAGRAYAQRVALGSAPSPLLRRSDLRPPRRWRRGALWGFSTVVAVALLGLVTAVLAWSGATLAADATALARVEVQPFGGTLVRARAVAPDGRTIPLLVRGGRLTPRVQLTPGERVSVEAVIRRPGWLAWAAAARSWERLGRPVAVSWFPAARSPVLVSSPAPGAPLTPAAPIRLTFSKPLAAVLGSARPKLSPRTRGRWRQADSHTLVFVPSGFGAGFATDLRVRLPRAVAVVGRAGRGLRTTRGLEWTLPPGSLLRLQQLLAEAGYLPLEWQPSGPPVARTLRAELRAAVDAPKGRFSWRYPTTPG